MKRIRRQLLLALVLLASTAPSVIGQVVTGKVMDAETDSVIMGATISLAPDTAAAPLASAVTVKDGSFTITIPRRGVYVLHGSRLGYASTWSRPFYVDRRDTLDIQFRLATAAIPIKPLEVVVRRPGGSLRLANWGFYDRMIDPGSCSRAVV